jgi:Transposase and inactivated derivatives
MKIIQHAAYTLESHIVWVPQSCSSGLVTEVAGRVRTILHERADDKALEILELTVQPDHIHWFVSSPSNTEPALLANWVSRLSSRKDIHRHADHDGETLGWARGHSVGTAGPAGHVSSETVNNDIQRHEGDES